MYIVSSQIDFQTISYLPNVLFFLLQVVAALSVSLVSMIVGYVSAYTSPAAESMKEELSLTEDMVITLPQFLINQS